MLLEFEGLKRPILFVGCDNVAHGLLRVLHGWTVRIIEDSPRVTPIITVKKSSRGYYNHSPRRSKPVHYTNRVDAVCSIIVDLINAYIAADPTRLCLHSAAAKFSGRLVVFPNYYRAGKSMMSVSLAAAGIRIFSDDVLPVDRTDNHGVAPGILPRLRIPLPENNDSILRDYVKNHSDIHNKRYLYVAIGDGVLAPLGEKAPIGGFVLLHREDGVETSIEPVKASTMLKNLFLRNFAIDVSSLELMDQLHDLVDGAYCCKLHYENASEAVALLKRTFNHWPKSQPATRAVTSTTTRTPENQDMLVRSVGITERLVDDEIFLIDQNGNAVFHLNATSSALWNMLAAPTSHQDAVGALQQAFPDVPAELIERDVRALLDYLSSNGLIRATS